MTGLKLRIDYFAARQLPAVSYRNPFSTVELRPRQTMVIERSRVAESFELDENAAERFACVFLLGSSNHTNLVGTEPWEEIIHYEQLAEGMQEYF